MFKFMFMPCNEIHQITTIFISIRTRFLFDIIHRTRICKMLASLYSARLIITRISLCKRVVFPLCGDATHQDAASTTTPRNVDESWPGWAGEPCRRYSRSEAQYSHATTVAFNSIFIHLCPAFSPISSLYFSVRNWTTSRNPPITACSIGCWMVLEKMQIQANGVSPAATLCMHLKPSKERFRSYGLSLIGTRSKLPCFHRVSHLITDMIYTHHFWRFIFLTSSQRTSPILPSFTT